ncbi:hypothetical protein Goarm_006950 [Gossypium armourianum]|uniref:Uncharacterized protein n=1 Tax=Gossypium armourianum TaxID=34283 RepID=A0A7J9JL32_9ROSI|nr:hypothetical protein [Gossypium armourianum]
MALRSSGSRKLSFEILSKNKYLEGGGPSLIYQSSSDPFQSQNGGNPSRHNRKKKKHKKRKDSTTDLPIIAEDLVDKQHGSSDGSVLAESKSENYGSRDNGNVNRISYVGGGSVVVLEESVCQNVCGFGELRQRNVNGVVAGGGDDMETVAARADESVVEVSSSKEPFPPVAPQSMANGNVVNTLKTSESLDWKRVMAEDPNFICCGNVSLRSTLVLVLGLSDLYTVDKSPLKYFLDEMHNGNSLRNTTTLGSEKERERVYDTIFRLPWRCEVVILALLF